MKCQNCNQNEATAYLRSTVNGKTTELHLCAECAKKLGVDSVESLGAFSPMDIFGSLFSGVTPLIGKAASLKRCPDCGSSFEEIASTGKAGCPQCYTVFREEFLPTLRRIHGNAKHMGKLPSSAGDQIKTQRELENLKDQLRRAVDAQEYEKAAEYRDRIKEIEKQQEA